MIAMLRTQLFAAGLGALTVLAPLTAQQPHGHPPVESAGPQLDMVQTPRRTRPYDPELVHAFRALPVQDQGRIKPVESVAQVLLLKLNGKRSVSVPDEPEFGDIAGDTLSSAEWLMDMLLYQEQAVDYPVFVVTDSEVLRIVGLSSVAKRKRDRYSYRELAPGIEKLAGFFDEYSRIDPKEHSRLQGQIVDLGHDLLTFRAIFAAFDPVRARFPVGDAKPLRTAFGDATHVRFSESLAQAQSLRTEYARLQDGGADSGAALTDFLRLQSQLAHGPAPIIVWLPPADRAQEEWLDLGMLLETIVDEGAEAHRAQIEAVRRLEDMIDAAADPTALGAALPAFVAHVRGLADARGEADKIDLEVSYHEADYFYNSLIWYLLGFVATSLMWLWPRGRVLPAISWILALAGTGYLVTGIVTRCVLLSRPPVSTLYETILFITGCAVIVALIIEAITRRRIAISLATFLGALGMFVAGQFELMEQKDTLQELQAVLRTNFWLATHVTTVTMGYAAGLLAGFIAHVYLLGKLFGIKRDSYSFYRNIGRMVYGVLCFGVVFSTVGTILGGVWANYSWGRFWGWDPKENGALMIVLWELLILHGRLGGFWRDWGVCMLAVFGNLVVAFSWFGVNLMEVGLHTYGFNAGTNFWLHVFYGTQWLVIGLGLLARYLDQRRSERSKQVDAPEPSGA